MQLRHITSFQRC